jgi:hypothetical protein
MKWIGGGCGLRPLIGHANRYTAFLLSLGFTDGQDFLDSENVKGGGCKVAIIHRFSNYQPRQPSGRRGFLFKRRT